MLNLAGAAVPEYMQGQAFLGPNQPKEREYAFGFRGRMDELPDLSYTLRDELHRYVRHFMPHRPAGQHLNYLWKMPATRSWEAAFKAGQTDATQSTFWTRRPPRNCSTSPPTGTA